VVKEQKKDTYQRMGLVEFVNDWEETSNEAISKLTQLNPIELLEDSQEKQIQIPPK
jgi:hypothetical protein